MFCELGAFKTTVTQFREAGGKGLNVTLPFKHEAWNIVNQLTPRALDAKAVNTIKIEDGRMVGDNTDGIGLVRDIKNNCDVPSKASGYC
jgi:shikimate dehydrogenase